MKEILGKRGEKEMQTPEHVPPGPVVIHPADRRLVDLENRIIVLESQMFSIQLAMQREIPNLKPPK